MLKSTLLNKSVAGCHLIIANLFRRFVNQSYRRSFLGSNVSQYLTCFYYALISPIFHGEKMKRVLLRKPRLCQCMLNRKHISTSKVVGSDPWRSDLGSVKTEIVIGDRFVLTSLPQTKFWSTTIVEYIGCSNIAW